MKPKPSSTFLGYLRDIPVSVGAWAGFRNLAPSLFRSILLDGPVQIQNEVHDQGPLGGEGAFEMKDTVV